MQRAISKSKQSNHAAKANQPRHLQNFAQRGDSQSDQQKNQGPMAGSAGDHINGIGAQVVVKTLPDKTGDRPQTEQKNGHFQRTNQFFRGGTHQKFLCRSIPEYRPATWSAYPLSSRVGRFWNSPMRRSYVWLRSAWSSIGLTFE